ncbi:PocR ligand-binding domain-containing protein [Hungatella hathewayi]|uniref:PocR ligand-binding domain-containing protein n=1 Tax=Hungatella hathewayi TaxID=154046 RepID=UPI003569F969
MDIRDIVDLKELQRIQNLFSDATGLAAIAVDSKGEYISEGSNFTDFCMKYTRNSPEGVKRCQKCDREGREAYFCHAGLMDFSNDIIVEGEKVGAIIGGQVLPEKPNEEKFRAIARELGIPEDEYMKALQKVPIRSEKMIRASAALLKDVINQWVNLMYFRKLNERKVEIFDEESQKVENSVKLVRDKTRDLEQIVSMEKILAVNASIEAGRAGKAGIGFSVVAEEIGRLARDSAAVYDEILDQVTAVCKSLETMEKVTL